MSEKDTKRTNRMINTFFDVSEEAMTNWGSDFIQTNVPQALDWVTNKLKEKIKLIAEKDPNQSDVVLPSMETFLKGIECGEWRKEMAIIYGMKKVGLAEEQIEQILEYAQQVWEPKELDNKDNSQ